MKLCVISDLHCRYALTVDDAPSETILISTLPRVPAKHHPVVAMLDAIEKDRAIKSDYLLCLGDLGDRADEQGIISAWTFAKEIQDKLGAKMLVGLPGNHDVNSRKQHGKEPFDFIKEFHENFPTNDNVCNSHFWAKGYCILIDEDALFLLINTIHDHTDADKALVASITSGALEGIANDLSALDLSDIKYKICIMHHHPIKHSNVKNWRDTDSLDKGDDLIKILNRFSFNIVIHGHKHQPRIKEDGGITVLAAGSFSCFANLQNTGFQQMFHVISLEAGGMGKKGQINSWEYTTLDGWQQSENSAFPPRIGYGGKLDIEKTANEIQQTLAEKGKKILFETITDKIPDIKYLIPDELIKLGETLDKNHGICTKPKLPLDPETISFKP